MSMQNLPPAAQAGMAKAAGQYRRAIAGSAPEHYKLIYVAFNGCGERAHNYKALADAAKKTNLELLFINTNLDQGEVTPPPPGTLLNQQKSFDKALKQAETHLLDIYDDRLVLVNEQGVRIGYFRSTDKDFLSALDTAMGQPTTNVEKLPAKDKKLLSIF